MSGLDVLRLKVHLNLIGREISGEEKGEWVKEARRLLQERGFKGTQKEIAKALGLSIQWVSKYDPNPIQHQEHRLGEKVPHRGTLYSVWGFKDSSWRKLVLGAELGQPRSEFYHGVTPAFVEAFRIDLVPR